jgi:hypothetical protein
MEFTQPCFIRKNTPELRKKLEELGYNRYPRWMADWNDDDPRYKYLVTDVLYYTYPQEPSKPKRGEHINCGTNEELFLALAALRDDSDYMQWFVVPKTRTKRLAGCFGQIIGMDGHYQEIVGYEWYRHENKDKALTERINEMMQIEGEDTELLPHKATVEELIRHFTNG